MLALTYQLFAVLAGWLEAILYARRAAESFSSNEHGGMTWQRLAVVLVAAVAVLEYQWLGGWLAIELVPLALLFPLAHDEAYNFTRLWIDFRSQMSTDYEKADRLAWTLAWERYTYGYQSPTTTARNDFSGRQRTWLAIVGGVGLLALYGYWLFTR